MLRYTVPFMVISGVFWLLHTWILDPMPNKFKRQEFIRYRREMLHVASKLNFRTPAREVRRYNLRRRRSCSNAATQFCIDAYYSHTIAHCLQCSRKFISRHVAFRLVRA